MASPKFISLVLFSLLSIYAPCSSFEDHDINLQPPPRPPTLETTLDKVQKVNLSLYYEALCPFSARFIVNGLAKVLDKDLTSIVNPRLIPYGNAHIQQPDNTVVCQHGPDECYLNSIEACAINSWPDVEQHYKFIRCVEDQTRGGLKQPKEDVWKSCCKKLGMNPDTVQSCYDSGLEKKLILGYANETDHLVPPSEYVPWVVVNKQPLLSDYENFVEYVCAAYQGPKPDICSTHLPKINSAGDAKQNQLGCYKDEEHRK